MIIVTGGAGMIGSNIVAALNAEGRSDIIVVDDLTDGHKIQNLADLAIADYLDKDDFLPRLESGGLGRIEAVFHQGACSTTTEWNGKYMMEVNYAYSKRLLHACLAARLPFLYASSASVYGGGSEFREEAELERPLNVYAYSKKLFDDYVRRTVFPGEHSQVAGLRYFNVYGPREAHKGSMASVALHLFNQVGRGENPKLFGAHDGFGPGEQSRDFIHVGDVADVNLWLWRRGASGIFNCGTGRAQPFRTVAETVIGALGKGEVEFIDFPHHLKGRYQSFTQADMTRLRAAGYNGAFRSVETGVRDYVEWLKAQLILVIGPRWVGDMVMAQCLFSALKEIHPDAAIDVMAPAWAAPLVGRMPEIRARIDAPFSRKKLEFGARRRLGRSLRGRYDIAYVMQGSWKSALVPFFAGIRRKVGHLREMRYGLLNEIVPLPETMKRKTAEAFFSLARGGTFRAPKLTVDAGNQTAQLARFGLERGRFAALMPGAEFGPAKRWPSQYYAGLARDLMERGLGVALFGSANDRVVTEEIAALAPGVVDLSGQTRLEDAIDLLAAARLAVSNDSGLMHIAAAVETPIVAVYGSTSPDNTPPLTANRELLWLGLECSPCHQKICPLGHFNCMNLLPVETVSAATGRLVDAATP